LPCVVPLTAPAVVPLVDVPGALPGVDAEPLVLLSGEAALPEGVVLAEPLMPLVELGEVDMPGLVEAVVVGDVVVSVLAEAVLLGVVVVVVVVLLGVDAVVVSGVVLLVVLLRSQPAAAVASAMAAARGIRRFMTSPVLGRVANAVLR
jgi:hypothetical protein